VVILLAQDETIAYANPVFLKALKTSLKAVKGKRISDLVTFGDPSFIDQLNEQLSKDQTATIDLEFSQDENIKHYFHCLIQSLPADLVINPKNLL
jgi:nitrogen-specific signal transduction histidine kinase